MTIRRTKIALALLFAICSRHADKRRPRRRPGAKMGGYRVRAKALETVISVNRLRQTNHDALCGIQKPRQIKALNLYGTKITNEVCRTGADFIAWITRTLTLPGSP